MPSKKLTIARCTAETKEGRRCKNKGAMDVSTNSVRCHVHTGTSSKPEERPTVHKPLPPSKPSPPSLHLARPEPMEMQLQKLPKKDRLVGFMKKVLQTYQAIHAHVGPQWAEWKMGINFTPFPNLLVHTSYSYKKDFIMEVDMYRPGIKKNIYSEEYENGEAWKLFKRFRVNRVSDMDTPEIAQLLVYRKELEALPPSTKHKIVFIHVDNLAATKQDAEDWAKTIQSLLGFPKSMTPFKYKFLHQNTHRPSKYVTRSKDFRVELR